MSLNLSFFNYEIGVIAICLTELGKFNEVMHVKWLVWSLTFKEVHNTCLLSITLKLDMVVPSFMPLSPHLKVINAIGSTSEVSLLSHRCL